MFYSQTFLARKGPLGTVWCAAHLQHRLKKSHYTSTDIPSTVDRIMFPEVPIALRLSGFLLLGVVRIYSKKVDYLFHDCTVVLTGLRKAFATIELTLPEDARQAPFQSITLPDTFDLDALDLDDTVYPEGGQDNHLRSQDDITLTDLIPTERDPYVAISFDEDIMMDSRPVEAADLVVGSTEKNIVPPPPENNVDDGRDPGFNDTDVDMRFNDDNIPPTWPETEVPRDMSVRDFSQIDLTESFNVDNNDHNNNNDYNDDVQTEIMRAAVHDMSVEKPLLVAATGMDAPSEPQRHVDETIDQSIVPTIVDENLTPTRQSLPRQQSTGPTASAASREAPDMFDMHGSVGLSVLPSTSPVQQPKKRGRKRKQQLFDESTVLTNKSMKKSLEESSDLLRKRRNIPCSDFGLWKLNNRLRKEQIFLQPSITGLCSDLCNILNKDYISIKSHLKLSEEDLQVPASRTEAFVDYGVAQSPAPEVAASPHSRVPSPDHASEPDRDIEREHLRDAEENNGNDILTDFVPPMFMPSFVRDDMDPTLSPKGPPSVPLTEGISGTIIPTPEISTFGRSYGSEFETPAYSDDWHGIGNTNLPDIPEMTISSEPDNLSFLEADNIPTGSSQGTPRVDSMSVRTRAVAKYLKNLSPISLIQEDSSPDLSLNKILEGKTRKLCARMFYETLVLKSYGLINVHQEVPYGDITLKLTSSISKSQI